MIWLWTFLFLLVFFVLPLLRYLRIRNKGKVGERKVAHKIGRLEDSYHVFNNLLLTDGKGYSSQIDHVVVSPYGIFVIETKNYTGTIYGSDFCYKWKKFSYGHEYEFYNPILQNRRHITRLRRLFPDIPQESYFSLIAFSNKAILKNTVSQAAHVIHFSEIRRTIRRFRKIRLDVHQMGQVCRQLKDLENPGRRELSRHIRLAQELQVVNDDRIAAGICPLCGGGLVERQGRYGRFYGCSNYPKCHFILHAD